MDSLILNSKSKTVSFLIPCYNHEKYVYKTLDSIRDDQYPSKEIIIIDDGSTDSSVDVIKKWIHDNPDINIRLYEQTNSGIVFTINKLIKLSTGEYIRLFSSDDLNMPDSTSKLFNALIQNTNCNAVFSDARVIDQDDNLIFNSAIEYQKKNRKMYITDLGRALITEWGVSGPCILYTKKSYYDVLNTYNESLTIEDWYSYLRFYSSKKILFLDDYVIYYRVHINNNSRSLNRPKRILNQLSHKLTIDLVTPYFDGIEKFLLFSQKMLVLAKLNYLKRRYISGLFYLFYYVTLYIIINIYFLVLKVVS